MVDYLNKKVSVEWIGTEIDKMMEGKDASWSLKYLIDLNILDLILKFPVTTKPVITQDEIKFKLQDSLKIVENIENILLKLPFDFEFNYKF